MKWALQIVGCVLLSACTATPAPSVTHSAVPVARCGAGEVAPGPDEVLVFFTCANAMLPDEAAGGAVIRPTAGGTTEARLTAALEALVRGPTEAEARAGYQSVFSEATAGALNGVSLGADGFAAVDLGDIRFLGTASTSTGSLILTSQLNATVFQFREIRVVEYSIHGSCLAFWRWLQSDCHAVERPG